MCCTCTGSIGQLYKNSRRNFWSEKIKGREESTKKNVIKKIIREDERHKRFLYAS
jgi:hypothetical protein